MNEPTSKDETQPRFGRRWVPISVGMTIGTIAGCAILVALHPNTEWVAGESGPIEALHIGVWAVSMLIAAAAFALHRDRVSRLMDFWILTLAAAAFGRELDLHTLLNPGGILGAYGVRYRIDWWLSVETPVTLRLAWGCVILAGLAALALPPLLTRAPTPRLLRAGDGASWTFLASLAFLFLGYASDDLLGRGQFLLSPVTMSIEETAESAGAILFALSAWISLRFPLGVRIAWVRGGRLPLPDGE